MYKIIILLLMKNGLFRFKTVSFKLLITIRNNNKIHDLPY